MYTSQLSDSQPSTILQGVLVLWEMQSYPIALIIFFASIVLPLIKLFALTILCYVADETEPNRLLSTFKTYKSVAFFGKWSMIDVFVIAVLVALVQIEGIIEIMPGEAVIYFFAMVLASMFASKYFDSRTLWDNNN